MIIKLNEGEIEEAIKLYIKQEFGKTPTVVILLDEFLEWYVDDIEELTDEVRDSFYEWFNSNFNRFVEYNLVEVE